MNLMGEAIKKLKAANNIAIISHMNPDGDTVGSATALYFALKKAGKQAYLFCDDTPQGKLLYIKGSEFYNTEKIDKYDVCVCIDSSDISRFSGCYSEYKKSDFKINIDHHATNDRFGDLTLLDAHAAATAEVVYNLIKEYDSTLIDNTIAHCLYCALVTDSGCFAFSSVGKNTMLVASQLLEFDINQADIAYHFYKKTSINYFNLKNRVLSKARFFADNRVCLICFMAEDFVKTETTQEDTQGIINSAIDIETVEVAIAVTQIDKYQYKVSFRTKDSVDASRCAMVFGGGGHARAAGCRVSGHFEDIIDRLIKAATDSLPF